MKRNIRIVLAFGLALSTAVLGTAVAEVTVYDNDFSSRGEFEDISRAGGGKRCDRSYRDKSKAMRAAVRRSPTTCSFRPPVQGDKELPNHDIRIDGKILKETPKSVRGKAFIEVTARAGGGNTGYTLRVFPQKKRYELTRSPGGGGFPARGKSDAIKKTNKRNALRLAVTGARVRAFVNGEELADVTDSNPGQVPGRKVRFSLGSLSEKQKDVAATFKRVAVAVPDP